MEEEGQSSLRLLDYQYTDSSYRMAPINTNSTVTSTPLHPSSTPQIYPSELRILTLNCWGLKYISTFRSARLAQIGHEISLLSPTPHIVCLQECWTQADYSSIHSQTAHILPYSKFYHSGIFGGGLAIFSVFPIQSSSMLRYPLNGRPTAFFRGDWFVGKGVACASLRVGLEENDVVEVLNTHLHAPYEQERRDSYLCHRTAQAWEIAKLARAARERGRLVLAVGDFNMIPRSLAHEVVRTVGGVVDCWRCVYPQSSLGPSVETIEDDGVASRRNGGVEYNMKVNGTTCDSRANTWRMGKEASKKVKKGVHVPVDWEAPDRRAKRLDYVFFSDQPISGKRWTVQQATLGMTTRHPTLHCSLSDHFSVETTLTLADSSAESVTSVPSPYLPLTSYDAILTDIHTYTRREYKQREFRMAHFGLSIFVAVGCHVAVFWSPHHFVSFLLMLLSTLGLGAGLLDGLIGGFFVGSELRALREFEWEVRNARMLAEEAEGSQDGDGVMKHESGTMT